MRHVSFDNLDVKGKVFQGKDALGSLIQAHQHLRTEGKSWNEAYNLVPGGTNFTMHTDLLAWVACFQRRSSREAAAVEILTLVGIQFPLDQAEAAWNRLLDQHNVGRRNWRSSHRLMLLALASLIGKLEGVEQLRQAA